MQIPQTPQGDSPVGQDHKPEGFSAFQTHAAKPASEPVLVFGDDVPGNPGAAAWMLRRVDPTPVPVVIAVPHAGRAYSDALLGRMRHPASATQRLEDRHVDLIGIEVARRTGAPLLVAQAPRAMIDLNRAVDDVDWEMVTGGADLPHERGAFRLGNHRRARSGLGLVPRRLPGMGEIWNSRLDRNELDERIACVHEPYHATLAQTLHTVRDRWGAALLIDLHSMPPLPPRVTGERTAEFVLGDRFGASCDGALVASVFGHFARERRLAAHNRPYAGGYVLERHARRSDGIHCLQLEIDRQAYLDARLDEPGEGFDAMVDTITALVRHIAADVAEIGRDQRNWRAAAE
jgi:N-formylglutamate amidohydrolase